jgi:hypothetical protein
MHAVVVTSPAENNVMRQEQCWEKIETNKNQVR